MAKRRTWAATGMAAGLAGTAVSVAQPSAEALPEGGRTPGDLLAGLTDPLAPRDVPEIEPTHDLTFAESIDIGSVLFLPDGDRALVQLRPEVVEAWPLAVHYAPEILGVLSALLLIPLLWVLVRIRRRPRRVGAPHCRRCNYDLSAHVPVADGSEESGPGSPHLPAKCPECGAGLAERRPIRGTTRRRRAIPWGIAVGIIVVGYTFVLLFVPRNGWASGLATLPSLRLHTLAEENGLAWLKPFYSRCEQWVEVDFPTGKVVRRLPIRQSITWVDSRISPDGRFMAMWGPQGEVACVRVKDGRTVAVLEESGGKEVGGETQYIVGFSDQSDALYVAYVDVRTKNERLVRWDFCTDTTTLCIEAPVHLEDFGTPGRPLAPFVRRYRVVGGAGPARYLAAPAFMEAYPDIGYFIRLYDEQGELLGEYPIAGASPMNEPIVSPDGTRVFVSGSINGLLGFDVRGRKRLPPLRPGRTTHPLDELALSPDGRLLFASCYPNVILARDIEAKRWAGKLSYKKGYIAPDLDVSPDGRWLAAVPFESVGGGTGGPFLHHLLIFDLSQLEGD